MPIWTKYALPKIATEAGAPALPYNRIVRLTRALALLLLALPAGAQIGVPYRGLEYSMLSRDGITVMIAPLDLSILNYSAAHVWISNGSRRAIQVTPQAFTTIARNARHPEPGPFIGLPDNF